MAAVGYEVYGSNKWFLKKEDSEENVQSVKEVAKLYLGEPYLKVGTHREKIRGPVSGDLISINDLGLVSIGVVKKTAEECETELRSSLNLHLTVPMADAVGQIATNSGQERAEGDFFVMAMTCLKIDRCAIKSLPEPKIEREFSENIIISGMFCTGYKIFIRVSTRNLLPMQKSSSKKVKMCMALCKQFEISQEKVMKKLEKRTITSIRFEKIDKIGEYVPGKESLNSNNIVQIVMNLRKDFEGRCAKIISREFRVDLLKDLSCNTSLSEELASLENLENNVRFFRQLEEEIISTLHKDYLACVFDQLGIDREGKSVALNQMLVQINEIFSIQFQHVPEKSDEPYTLVIGKTGAGKSLLIGYLLGFPLGKKKIEVGSRSRKKDVYDYRNEVEERFGRPKIGHGSSETKGALVYGNYIDASGLSDISGFEADVCNAVAMQMIVDRYQPQKVIIVFDSSFISTNRASGFFELIEVVNRIIDNASGKNVLGNILFVINDKNGRVSVDDIMCNLEDAIESLKEERNKYIPSGSEYDSFRKESTWGELLGKVIDQFGTQKFDHDAKKFDESVKFVARFQNKIEILSQLQQENIIIADFSNKKMRNSVLAWLESQRKGIFKYLNAQNAVPGGKTRVIAAVNAAKAYFDFLQKEHDRYLKTLSMEATVSSISSSDNAAEVVKDFETKIATLESKRREISENILKLKQDNTPVEWPSLLEPEPKIIPRSVFAYFNWMASSYLFQCTPDVPNLVRCKYIEHGSTRGTFSTSEDGFLKDRKVVFTPAWWGQEGNCRTKIQLWVDRKDHPNTQAEIEKNRGRLKQIEEDLAKIASSVADLKKKSNSDPKSSGSGIENQEQNLLTRKKLEEVHEKLNKYKKFIMLINQLSLILSMPNSVNRLSTIQSSMMEK